MTRHKLASTLETDGVIVREIDENLGRRDGPHRVLSVWDTVLQPGTMLDPHMHPDVEEVYYILEGKGEILVGEETRLVRPRQLVYIPPRQLHTIRPAGNTPLRWITIAVAVDANNPPVRSRTSESNYIA
jgi:mannose-6-phosphate isomerase-like protein (cupin superfamily)